MLSSSQRKRPPVRLVYDLLPRKSEQIQYIWFKLKKKIKDVTNIKMNQQHKQ